MATEKKQRRGYRLRITIFLLSVLLFLVALNVLSQAVNTLHELDRIEAERDQWQRPADVLNALDLKPGSVVADLGSGAGYFALKLSSAVGTGGYGGKVLAIDLRRLSLTFLWIRSLLRHQHNVSIVVGETDNPRLSTNVADAVLVANTYHELADSRPILSHILQSLRPGGRLVVVDRSPEGQNAAVVSEDHEIPEARVESELAEAGFTVMSRDMDFIERPGDHWWLIIARKPL